MENTRLCSYCNGTKQWTWNGKTLKDGSKIYLDGNGSRWAGRRCPDCEKQRVQAAIKCDSFKRDLVLRELTSKGFRIISRTHPIVVEREGKTLSVSVQDAFTRDGKLILDKLGLDPKADLHALVFASVRIFSNEHLENLRPNIELYANSAPS